MRLSHTLPVLVLAVLLAGCGYKTTSISAENANPLTASRYGDELADGMAKYIINNDPIIKDAKVRSVIDAKIALGKKISTDAREIQSEGMKGGLIPVKTDTEGYVLYVNDTLYLSSDFSITPGADLHVYLSVAVDPRDSAFPDKTALDLGSIQKIYGAQQYPVPHQKDPMRYRTLILWDKALRQMSGFAQLSK